VQFGTYTFPAGWSCTTDTDEQTVPMVAIPRSQGGAWLTAQRKPRKWQIEGGFTNDLVSNTAGASVRTAIDGLKAAILAGPSNFYLDTDRYWRNVQVETAPTDWQYYYALFGAIRLGLVGPDPYAYSTTTTTTAELSIPLAYTVPTGNAYCLPVWYLYVSQSLGAAFSWTWTNATSSETMILSGAWPVAGGGYYIVDTLAQTVQFAASLGGTPGPTDASGSRSAAFAMFEGQMPRLVCSANIFSLTYTGFAPGGVWATYSARWL
jgi:hypothetical protein